MGEVVWSFNGDVDLRVPMICGYLGLGGLGGDAASLFGVWMKRRGICGGEALVFVCSFVDTGSWVVS
jgi:hypothetical protein